MNKVQREYLEAKVQLEMLLEEQCRIEQQYIMEHGIRNKNGSIPRASWEIDDDAIADKAMDECARIEQESGLWAQIVEARKVMRAAEDALVTFGLGFIPDDEDRRALEHAVKQDYSTRKKVIDLTIRIDVATIPI